MDSNTHVVIMAGGIGSRLWPASTPEMPKQFIDILGVGRSLIQLTVDRFSPVCDMSHFWVVTSSAYVDTVKSQLPEIPQENILAEPEARNTAPCIAYSCWKIMSAYPDANIVVTPADALVLDKSYDVYRATAPSRGVEPKEGITAWVRVLDTSDIPEVPEPGSGEEPSDDAILDYGYIKQLLAQKYDVANVINEWSETPSTILVPSEALVRSEFEKAQEHSDSLIVDSWGSEPASDKAPSERLVKEALDTKTDKVMAIPEWDSTVAYNRQSTVVYEGIVYISTINNNTDKVPSVEDMFWTPLASQSGSGGGGVSVTDHTFAAYIGDGESTVIDVEHNLGSENVFVELRTADGREYVRSTIRVMDENTVRVTFRHAPEVNSIVILVGTVEASPNAIVETVGDGENNTFVIEHNWGTYNVFSQFRDALTGELVFADVTAIDPSHVQIGFSRPPERDSIVFYMAPCIPTSSVEGFTYTQREPSDEWVINHGLNRFVAVYTATLDGEEMSGWVKQDMTSLNSVTIRFSEPVTGIAYLR